MKVILIDRPSCQIAWVGIGTSSYETDQYNFEWYIVFWKIAFIFGGGDKVKK